MFSIESITSVFWNIAVLLTVASAACLVLMLVVCVVLTIIIAFRELR